MAKVSYYDNKNNYKEIKSGAIGAGGSYWLASNSFLDYDHGLVVVVSQIVGMFAQSFGGQDVQTSSPPLKVFEESVTDASFKLNGPCYRFEGGNYPNNNPFLPYIPYSDAHLASRSCS